MIVHGSTSAVFAQSVTELARQLKSEPGRHYGTGRDNVRSCRIAWIERRGNKELFDVVESLFRSANRSLKAEVTSLEPLQFTIYNAGQNRSEDGDGYDWHIDHGSMPNSPIANRKLSMTIQLDHGDAYEGGDLEINMGQIFRASRRIGAVTIFPSWALHRVAPVTRGMRRSLVAWMQGPRWR